MVGLALPFAFLYNFESETPCYIRRYCAPSHPVVDLMILFLASYSSFSSFFFIYSFRGVVVLRRMTSDHYMCFALLLIAICVGVLPFSTFVSGNINYSLCARATTAMEYAIQISQIGVGTSDYLSSCPRCRHRRRIRRFCSFTIIHTNVLICSRLYLLGALVNCKIEIMLFSTFVMIHASSSCTSSLSCTFYVVVCSCLSHRCRRSLVSHMWSATTQVD